MNPKQRLKLKTKKSVISILNEIRNASLDCHFDLNTVVKMLKNYPHNKTDSILSKYLKDSSSIDQIIDKIEIYRDTKESPL